MMLKSNLFSGIRSLAPAGALAVLLLAVAAPGSHAAEKPPLPETANAVIHFDLERLRDSDLYAQVEDSIGLFARSDEQLQMFLQATGLAEAAATMKGFTIYSFSDPQHPQDFAGVLTSDFGAETRARLEQAYAPVARSVGGRIIMPVIQTPETEIVMSFLGPGRLTFGTARAVEMVVDEGSDGAAMIAAYQRTATRRPVWGIINARDVVNSLMADLGGEGNPLAMLEGNEALQSLTAIGFSLDLGTDLFFEMRAVTDSPEQARLLADALKGAAALGVMGANQTDDADVVEFFRGVVTESERDSVYVSFSVTAGQIERLQQGEAFLQDLIP
jgi:hypothetical protein